MNKGAHVLLVSRDQMLLQTRALILGAYFQVQSAGRVTEAEAAMAKTAFDLVVLCYSLSDGEYSRLAELCGGRTPALRILTLRATANGNPRPGDGEYTVENGPYGLLKTTAEMIGFPLKSTSRTSTQT